MKTCTSEAFGAPTCNELKSFLSYNRANKVLGWSKIGQGGLSGTVADPKVIFQVALKSNSSSFILAHNHPSGNKGPSEADIRLTKKLMEAGKIFDLPVLDHTYTYRG